jgi:cellulose synthase/poly-beta-1,6-N-acetylglucosamine synthase-like glycosyltransferase
MDAPLIVTCILGAAILYFIAGYPLLLLMRRRRVIQKKFTPRTVTVLLAVKNGEAWLEQKLRILTELDYPRGLVDIVVISDGSTDGTESIAQSWNDRGVTLIARPSEGKAAALNAGMERARGEILLFTDVRQRFAPESLRELIACFHDPSVGVVSGELIIEEGNSREESSVGLYWKYEKWIRMQLSGIDSILGATGCICAMRRELAVPMPKGILIDDVFLPLAAFFRGFRCVLEPAAKAFDIPTSLDAEFRRKVRTQAGVYQLLRYYPQLLGPKNRMWIDFVSHKFGRLLLPWLLLALFASSFWLRGAWRVVLAAQVAFYVVAIGDRFVPDRWRIKRVTSPVRTLVTLMAAGACAVAIFFVPPERLWKMRRDDQS